jgi:MFS family permease
MSSSPVASAVPTPDTAHREATRRRLVGVLIGGVALGSTGHIAAVTVTSLVALAITGDRSMAGVPAAVTVLGAALGATSLAAMMARRGRRIGLVAGYAIGVVGAVVAIAGVVGSLFPLLLLGSLLIGFGNSSNQLSRYAAADLYPPDRRASAIGIVVWAATIGAVIGPNLVEPSGEVAMSMGLPALAGPYLVPIVLVALASLSSFVFLRPDPYELADRTDVAGAGPAISEPIRAIIRRPTVALAILALVIGQFVMVLIMTMTPLHMTDHHHSLQAVGLVISGHTFGMFALAPVSGKLTDRYGPIRVIYSGTAILALAGVLSAAAPPENDLVLGVALFLLGWGWNLGFVAGSAMLSGGVSLAERARVQGVADALIWSTAAIASLGSGVLLASLGYASLGILGAVLVGVVAAVFVARAGAAVGRGIGPGGGPPLQPAID